MEVLTFGVQYYWVWPLFGLQYIVCLVGGKRINVLIFVRIIFFFFSVALVNVPDGGRVSQRYNKLFCAGENII